MTEPKLIPLSELRALLAAQEVRVSESELKRMRANGLLACEQVHIPGERGSTSLYPSWAVRQVESVERLSRKERRFRQLRVLVRWHDSWVEPDRLRESLIWMVDGFSAKVRELADGPGDEIAAVERVASELMRKPGRSRAQRLIRRRLKGQDLDRIAFALVALGLGTEIEWDNHDPAAEEPSLRLILERAFGVERARQDGIAGKPSLLVPGTSTEALLSEIQATGSFDVSDTARVFRESDDVTINQGFADARVLASLAPIAQAVQIIYSEDVAGLASLEALIDSDFDALGIALLVRQAILMRRWVPIETWESIKESVQLESPKAIALIEMHRALPEYRTLLTGDSEAKLAALPAAEREELQARVRDFFAQRPELAAAIND